jgi:hypothetical protein
MARAYAVGAGTQTLTQGIGEALSGTGELSTALSLSAGWVITSLCVVMPTAVAGGKCVPEVGHDVDHVPAVGSGVK